MKNEYEKSYVTCESFDVGVRKCEIEKKWTVIMEESPNPNPCEYDNGTNFLVISRTHRTVGPKV